MNKGQLVVLEAFDRLKSEPRQFFAPGPRIHVPWAVPRVAYLENEIGETIIKTATFEYYETRRMLDNMVPVLVYRLIAVD